MKKTSSVRKSSNSPSNKKNRTGRYHFPSTNSFERPFDQSSRSGISHLRSRLGRLGLRRRLEAVLKNLLCFFNWSTAQWSLKIYRAELLKWPIRVAERLINISCFSAILTVETLLGDHTVAPGNYNSLFRRLRQTAKELSLWFCRFWVL